MLNMDWVWSRPFVQEYINRYQAYWLKTSLTSPSARELGVVLAVLFGTGAFARLMHFLIKRRRFRRLRERKCQQREVAICKLTEKVEQALNNTVSRETCEEIVNLSLRELQGRLKDGRLSPSQVLVAYQLKALEVHRRTNCLVEPLVEAEMWAEELEAGGKKHLPLYGVPVSIKDNFGIQGYDCTIGCAQWIDQPFADDAVIVKVLKQQGAVPFVKSNIPQTLLSFESSNPIYGCTSNPYNSERGVGGSSGGEGTLIACRGSVLGFGSDIGGSIRIPAAFCGVFGFKPSKGRLSSKGTHPIYKGQTIVQASYGPMARDVDSLVEAMRVLLVPTMFHLDTKVPPMPFDEKVYSEKRHLRVGYYTYDGFIHAVPACQRAVQEAVEALQAQGHEVVEWNFSRFGPRLANYWAAAILGDGCDELAGSVAGDSVDPSMRLGRLIWPLNYTMKKLLSFIISPLVPNLGMALKNAAGAGSVSKWWKLTCEIQDMLEEVTEDWQAQGLDVVVCPGFTCPAMTRYLPGLCQGAISYTGAYNVLNFPAGSVPVSKVTKTDVDNVTSYPATDLWHKLIKKDQTGSEGLPVNVQVVTLPWQDEMCLRVMKELETALSTKT